MSSAKKTLEQLRREPTNVRFADLRKICELFFGDPRVNIQDAGGKAKPYQVRQVLQAIDKLEGKQ